MTWKILLFLAVRLSVKPSSHRNCVTHQVLNQTVLCLCRLSSHLCTNVNNTQSTYRWSEHGYLVYILHTSHETVNKMKFMFKVKHTVNISNSSDGNTTDVLTVCVVISRHFYIMSTWVLMTSWNLGCSNFCISSRRLFVSYVVCHDESCKKKKIFVAVSVCRRQRVKAEEERLWLLDLFLWLHHVVVEGSKGDNCFFFFFIHSLDGQKTPVRLPDHRHLKREKPNDGWGNVWGTMSV